MTRTGETVVVPIGCTLMRCGMSEPVMKTARSSTFWLCFEVCLTFGSASTVPANMLAATRIVTLEYISVLTIKNYTREGVVCKLPKTRGGILFAKARRAVAGATALH